MSESCGGHLGLDREVTEAVPSPRGCALVPSGLLAGAMADSKPGGTGQRSRRGLRV